MAGRESLPEREPEDIASCHSGIDVVMIEDGGPTVN